jgi:peroxiredoxin (alkyl hydroperoxide reductase subunit C)
MQECECNNHNHEFLEICTCPRLGEPAPDFEADTTHGRIKFSEFNEGHWVILFSHPADFTPVCTTEFIGFAQKQQEFEKRNVRLLGLSIDSVYSHIAWIRQIEENFELKIDFPVIADLGYDVAHLYAMIHPAISEVHAIRTVYIVDPEGILRMSIAYPSSVGRNIDELIRIIDALQLVAEKGVATPANWKPGDNVVIPPPKTTEDAEQRLHEEHEECTDWYLCKEKP